MDKTPISDEDRALIVKFLARMLGGAKRYGHPGDEAYQTQSALLVEEHSELNALINRLQQTETPNDREML
jgi:hypothetical protein